MVCHTAPGSAEYAGGLAFPLPFGSLYSTNITADKDTGIGNYSDQDFLNAVQRGIRKDGARLYPAMPYTSYTFMTNADVLAIKAYLFSLPAVHRPNQGDTGGYPGAGDLSAQHSRSCLIPAGNDRDAGARVAESGRRSC